MAAGVGFLSTTFLEWFRFSAVEFRHSHTGWQTGRLFGAFPALIVVALVGWLVGHRLLPSRLPNEVPGLYLAGGGMVALRPTLKLIVGDEQPGWLRTERAPGLYFAVGAGLLVALAAYQKFDELFRESAS